MTVHKSQGSEFDEVLMILPDKESELLSKEIIYTGITRAKKKVKIWGKEELFKAAAYRMIERASGLKAALRKES